MGSQTGVTWKTFHICFKFMYILCHKEIYLKDLDNDCT